MDNINAFLKESFNKEEILTLYQNEFKNLSDSFLTDYINSDDFKLALKNKIRFYIYSFFKDYKPKNSAIGNRFSFGYRYATTDTLFSNSLIDEYVDAISNDVLNKILGRN